MGLVKNKLKRNIFCFYFEEKNALAFDSVELRFLLLNYKIMYIRTINTFFSSVFFSRKSLKINYQQKKL